jgi:ribosomal protein L39E
MIQDYATERNCSAGIQPAAFVRGSRRCYTSKSKAAGVSKALPGNRRVPAHSDMLEQGKVQHDPQWKVAKQSRDFMLSTP